MHSTAEPRPEDLLRPALLGAVTAVYVARPLLVSESAATVAGDGLPLVMLTLVLAAVWWLAGAFSPRRTLRFGWADWAWTALMAWQAVGTLIAIRTGWARAAINVCWEWVGLGMGFLLLRQLVASDRELRALVVVMIAVALVVSADGLFQFYVSLPAMREEYRLHPEAVLRAAGVVAPAGSAARLLFEQRLRSTEPMATFALANSLAGFLVPWLVMTAGLACGYPRGSRGTVLLHWLIAAAVMLPLALCLVLTKSRSAYLASMLGLGGIAVARPMAGMRVVRFRRFAIFAVAMSMIVVLAIALGGKSLDRQILSEAAKSLSYRGHYWQAALRIIGDHPWFGCGLGNFQDIYTQYKLPLASEVVADPHNFLLEVWSTSGTPAMLALTAIFVGAVIDVLRRAAADITTDTLKSRAQLADVAQRHLSLRENSATFADRKATMPRSVFEHGDFGQAEMAGRTNAAVYAIVGGAIAGFVLAFLISLVATVVLPMEMLAIGSLAITAAALLAWRWIQSGELPPAAPLVAAGALLVNLLAAGGIAFSGVAGTLWLLLAVALGAGRFAPRVSLPRAAAIGALAASIALVSACHVSAYLPSLRCRMLVAEAEAEPRTVEQSLRAAAAADPLADQPWRDLAAVALARFQQGDRSAMATWNEAQGEMLRRRPFFSAAWRQACDGYFLIYRQTSEPRTLEQAIDHYRRAVDLYPTFALGRANLALALATADRRDEARQQAQEALTLHELTPHQDQKLPADLVRQLGGLLPPTALETQNP